MKTRLQHLEEIRDALNRSIYDIDINLRHIGRLKIKQPNNLGELGKYESSFRNQRSELLDKLEVVSDEINSEGNNEKSS